MSKSKAATCTAIQRAMQNDFKNDFYADGGILFCKTCNVSVNHSRSSVLKDHLQSKKHLKRKENPVACDEQATPAKRQATVTTSFAKQTQASQEREHLIKSLVRAFAAADIPLQKVNNPVFREWIQNNVKNGGCIPTANQLREHWLPLVADENCLDLKALFKGQKVAVHLDETTDCENRFVLNILYSAMPCKNLKNERTESICTYLMDTVFLSATNFQTVSQATIKCLSDNGVDFNNVLVVTSDNARYMKKCCRDVLSAICPNVVHITCFAHIINLLGDIWRHSFPTVDHLVGNMKKIFKNAPVRRCRYLEHLRINGETSPTLPPVPVLTRWNSWFDAVQYHAEHFKYYKEFIQKELDEVETGALTSLHELCKNLELEKQLKLISEKSVPLQIKLRKFESNELNAHLVYNEMVDMRAWFEFEVLNSSEDVQQTFQKCANKLSNYIERDQPGITFLEYLRCLDPTQLLGLNVNFEHMCKQLKVTIEKKEWDLYKTLCSTEGPYPNSGWNLIQWWEAKNERLPTLSSVAVTLLYTPTNSAEVERSFSCYNSILSERRHCLKKENLKSLNSLYFNAKK